MWKALIAIVTIIIVITISYLTYFWIFSKVVVYVAETGWEYLIYEEVLWDYNKTYEITDKIYYSLLNEDKIETYKWFWIFYDNPKDIESENLRSDAWCIIENKDIDKLEDLEEKYLIKQFSKSQYIIAEFPIKWFFSYTMWIIKVHPKLEEFAIENKLDPNSPVMEIYDIPNNKIIYRKEIILKDEK